MRCLSCHREGIGADQAACPFCGESIQVMLADMLPSGTLLNGGAFRIDYAVGQGGFGITYRATDTRLSRTVAIKEFFPKGTAHREADTGKVIVRTAERAGTKRALERFTREGRLLATVSHPNVVRIHQLFEEHDTAYLVMEYLAGRTLREELTAARAALGVARLSEGRVREVIGDIVSALSAVHGEGILHLDIKPENIMLVRDPLRGPGGERAVLIDFGAGRQDTGELMPTSTVFLTVPYAPPELMLRQGVGPESDIFQVGMLLHELLTGKLPPSAMVRLAGDTFNPRNLSEPWAGMLTFALRLERENRPPHIAAWWSAAFLSEPISPTADSGVKAPSALRVSPSVAAPTAAFSSADIVNFREEAARQAEEKRRTFLLRGALAMATLTGSGLLWALFATRGASDPSRMRISVAATNRSVDEIIDQLWKGFGIRVERTGFPSQYQPVTLDTREGTGPSSAVITKMAERAGATVRYDLRAKKFILTPMPLVATYCNGFPARIGCDPTTKRAVTPEQRTAFEQMPACSQHALWCVNPRCTQYRRNPVPSGESICRTCGLPLAEVPRVSVTEPLDAPRAPRAIQ